MILTYRLYQETSFKIFFFSRIIEKERVFNVDYQEYYCRPFWKVCFCMFPLSFIQISENVLL